MSKPTYVLAEPMAPAMTIIEPMRLASSAPVAAGARSMPKTSSVPTVWKATTTVRATSSNIST